MLVAAGESGGRRQQFVASLYMENYSREAT